MFLPMNFLSGQFSYQNNMILTSGVKISVKCLMALVSGCKWLLRSILTYPVFMCIGESLHGLRQPTVLAHISYISISREAVGD